MGHCVEHDWHYSADDYCPVCYGISLSENQLVEMLENILAKRMEKGATYSQTIGIHELISMIRDK